MLRCRDIALWGEIEVQGLSPGGNRTVEVTPLPADPDIGFIHSPGPGLLIGHLPVPPCLFVQFGGVFLHPPVDRGVIDWHTALKSSYPPGLRSADPVAAVPPHRPQDDLAREMTTREDAHNRDHFTATATPPSLCKSTVALLICWLSPFSVGKLSHNIGNP